MLAAITIYVLSDECWQISATRQSPLVGSYAKQK